MSIEAVQALAKNDFNAVNQKILTALHSDVVLINQVGQIGRASCRERV